MKKFLSFGKSKSKKSSTSDNASASGSIRGSTSSLNADQFCGYFVKEKELPKLHKAAWNGDLNKTKQLVKSGIGTEDREKRTALHLACAKGHEDIVRELLEWKARQNVVDNQHATPLLKAAECDREKCVDLLLDEISDLHLQEIINKQDKLGNACLHYAIQNGNVSLTHKLLDHQADPELLNQAGKGPLHIATAQKNENLCQALIDGDCDVDIRDSEKRTPLIIACSENSPALVKLFLENNADIDLKDRSGLNAEIYASKGSYSACTNLLLNHSTPGPRNDSATNGNAYSRAGVDPGGRRESFGDLSDSYSEHSREGRSLRADSWAESEEESIGLGIRENKGPRFSLNKFVKSSDDDQDFVMGKSKIPVFKDTNRNNAKSQFNHNIQQHSDLKGSKIPMIRKKSDNEPPRKVEFEDERIVKRSSSEASQSSPSKIPKPSSPAKAPIKSQMSHTSVQSQDSWGESESSMPPAPKPSLLRMGNIHQHIVEDDTDVETDDEDLPIMGLGPPPLKHTPKSNSDSKILDSEPSNGKDVKVAKSDVKTNLGIDSAKRRAYLEEMGISDIEDLSDDDDMDTTHADESLATPRNPRPSSGLSDWDSIGDMTPRTPRDTNIPSGIQEVPLPKMEEEDSVWDSDEEMEDENLNSTIKKVDGGDGEIKITPAKPFDAENEKSEQPKAPPRRKKNRVNLNTSQDNESNTKRQRVESINSDWDSFTEEVKDPLEEGKAYIDKPPSLNIKGKMIPSDDEEESAWDTDEGGLPTDRSGAAKPGIGITKIEENVESESEDESTSTWEIDRRQRKEAQKLIDEKEKERAEELRQQEWLEEKKKKEEELKKEAAIEIEKENKESAPSETIEIKPDLSHSLHAGIGMKVNGDITNESVRKHGRPSTDSFHAEYELEPTKSPIEVSSKTSFGFTTDDDRSNLLRHKREKAELEMEDAKSKMYGSSAVPDDEEEDSITRSDAVPESPRTILANSRDLTSPVGSYFHGVLGSTKSPINLGMDMNGDDHDGLSYSSTENDDLSFPHQGSLASATPEILNTSVNMNEPGAVVKLQEQVRESKRLFEKEKNVRTNYEQKMRSLDKEKRDLQRRLDDLNKSKSALLQEKVELESKVRNLDYTLKEEVEKRNAAEVLLSQTKEQLKKKDDQYTAEVQEKQQIEYSLQNIQMELRQTQNALKEIKEERDELAKQYHNEHKQRQAVEKIAAERVEFQQAAPELNTSGTLQLEHLNTSSDSNRQNQLDAIEINSLKSELERSRSRQKEEQSLLASENEELQSRIEDLKNDMKINEETLEHATMQYNMQLTSLKQENTHLQNELEKITAEKDKFDTELKSVEARLNNATSELEKSQVARTELERGIQREREEWSRMNERRDHDLSTVKDSNSSLSERVGAAEAKLNAVEHELSMVNTTLVERTSQLAANQKELEQRRTVQETQEYTLRKETEENKRNIAKVDSLQEKLQNLQHENMVLKSEIETLKSTSNLSNKNGKEVQERFDNLLQTIRSDYDKTRQSLEEKNTNLQSTIERYRDDLRNNELKRQSLDQDMKTLQMEHTKYIQQCSRAETSLEVSIKNKENIERENTMLLREMQELKTKLALAEDKQIENQAHINDLVNQLQRVEATRAEANQKLMLQSENIDTVHRSEGELKAHIHKLELANARLETSLKHELSKVESLQRDFEDSNRQVPTDVRPMFQGYSAFNTHVNDEEETANRSMMAQEAQEHKGMWESEIHSKSKLGLKIAQLEREKQELMAETQEEKRKTRKAAELKRAAETKLETVIEKNTELQKDNSTLKAHLKNAKRRFKEMDDPGSRINMMHSEFDRERLAMEGTISTLRRQDTPLRSFKNGYSYSSHKIDDINNQLASEIAEKERLDLKTRQLQQEGASNEQLRRALAKLEKSKRKLEDDFAQYRAHVNLTHVPKQELERAKTEYEVGAKKEINQKLEEVNQYLEHQAQARQHLDKVREQTESQLRADMNKNDSVLQSELNKTKLQLSELQAQLAAKEVEAQRFRDLYTQEAKVKDKLSNRLLKANDVAVNSKAALSLERQRNRILTSPVLIQPEHNGLHSMSPIGSGRQSPAYVPNSGPHDPLQSKLRSELNRSIAKHLESVPTRDFSRTPDHNLHTSYSKASEDYLTLLKRYNLLH